MKRFLIPVALVMTLGATAHAQTEGGHAGHDMASGDLGPAAMGYLEANDRMHEAMGAPMTGDPDVDFVRSMIPHHQGAIDMARVVLEHGTDPEVKKLAEEVIAAQEGEIAWMKEWLAKHGQ